MTDDEIVDDLLAAEGGFVDHPADHGGPTNFGITINTLATFRGRPVSVEEVRALTVQDARAIYHAKYLDPWNWVTDTKLKPFLVDYGVHAGIGGAVRGLQLALLSIGVEVSVDGLSGPQTRTAVESVDPLLLFHAAVKHRLLEVSQRALLEPRFRVLIKNGPPLQAAFLLGWTRRILKFL